MAGTHEPRLARVAAMVADPARSRMLSYLMTGEYASAGELARAASVTPATASGHLARLLQARFVDCEARGRHRYYRLADAEVAPGRGWLRRGSGRVVEVTDAGRLELLPLLGDGTPAAR